MRNPAWKRDELILALDLYFEFGANALNQNHEKIIELSSILNKLDIHDVKTDTEKFRNTNGVYMKVCNFLRFDPDYDGKGLERGGKLEEIIWNEYNQKREELHEIAQAIKGSLKISDLIIENNEEENEFPEGKTLYRFHKSKERNYKLIKTAKKKFKEKHGQLFCEVCGFSFEKVYGKIGEDYIEGHHIEPISNYVEEKKTKVNDIVMLCSNCHRMAHKQRPWLNRESLKTLLKKP